MDDWLDKRSEHLTTRTLQAIHGAIPRRAIRQAQARDKVMRTVAGLVDTPKRKIRCPLRPACGRASGPSPSYDRGVSRTRRLTAVLLLNLGLVAALVVVGLAAHSLAVFAAGADYLADAAAIGVSLLAIWIASRPHSHPKATTVAALLNATWLLVLNIAIIAAAIWHLATGVHHVDGLPVLIVSAIAAVVMVAGALILGGDADDDDGAEDLNVKAVLLDTAADAAAAAGVAVSGAIILSVGGWYWLDPATALAIALIIGYHALKLTRKIKESDSKSA